MRVLVILIGVRCKVRLLGDRLACMEHSINIARISVSYPEEFVALGLKVVGQED